MPNKNLHAAKLAKNNDFYTQRHDIEREVNAYLEFDPQLFRGKTVLLPCDRALKKPDKSLRDGQPTTRRTACP